MGGWIVVVGVVVWLRLDCCTWCLDHRDFLCQGKAETGA